MTEYGRPWKLLTLMVGLALLILGSFVFDAPDWDIPISLIMSLMAYITAPMAMRIMLERKWNLFPLMVFATWASVDGCYWLYWTLKNPDVLPLMRMANAPASLALYWACGIIWYFRGSLKEMSSCARAKLLPRQPQATPAQLD